MKRQLQFLNIECRFPRSLGPNASLNPRYVSELGAVNRPGFQLTDAFKRSTTNKKLTKRSPHVRESETVLDSEFQLVDSGIHVLDRSPGFRILQGKFSAFRIPQAKVFRTPESGFLNMGRQKRQLCKRCKRRQTPFFPSFVFNNPVMHLKKLMHVV